MSDPRARMELDENQSWKGPLRLIALGCLLTFLVGATIFAVVSQRETGDPAPAPGEGYDNQGP